jgi:hypothetical protein
MTDTIEVEVDGVVDDSTSGRAPRWGRPLAIAIVAALTLIVLVRAVDPGRMSRRPASPPAAVTSSTAAVASQDPRIKAAGAALAAWGTFAVSGQLDDLGEHFDPEGPQYRQLVADAHALRDPTSLTAYDVTLNDSHLRQVDDGRVLVDGVVTWTRPGEAEQRYAWELELRYEDGSSWRLWTVRDLARSGPPVP